MPCFVLDAQGLEVWVAVKGPVLACIPNTRPTAEAHNAESIVEKLILVLNVTLLRLRAKINF